MGRHMQSHIKASQEKNFLTIVNLQFHDNRVHKYSLYMYTFVTQTNLHVFQNSLWYEFGQANFFPKCHRKKKRWNWWKLIPWRVMDEQQNQHNFEDNSITSVASSLTKIRIVNMPFCSSVIISKKKSEKWILCQNNITCWQN